MGRRGPPKKLTELKLLQGTPGGRHKLNKAEPKPPKVRKAKPSFHLNKEAKRIFKRAAEHLEKLGILTEVDLSALTRYADIFAKWLQAKDFIEQKGLAYAVFEYQTPEERKEGKEKRLKHMQQFPHVNIYRAYGAELTRLEMQFGMTPSARASLSVQPLSDPKDSIGEKLFG